MNCPAELYQLFFNATTEAVFIVDAAAQSVLAANEQACRWSGYRPGELEGLFIEQLVRAQNGSALLRHGHDSREMQRDNLQLRKKNGELMAVSWRAVPVELNQRHFLLVMAGASPQQSDDPKTAASNIISSELADFPTLIGQSEKIRHVCRLIGSVAKCEATVLLQGESGTGKEIVANAIHAHSRRAQRPFVKVNCAALTETLLESELFGHVKGAFTGAIRNRCGRFKQADGGTILLDEIGSMSLAGQAKLLRVLQEHEFEPVGSSTTTAVNVRVIAATNADLKKAVSEGKFREDLFYRLNVFSIFLPPLRERKEDIPLLAQHFLHKYNLAVGKKIQALASETLAAMMGYDWPGNVRELENAVEHAVLVENSLFISPSSLPMNLAPKETSEPSTTLGLRDMLNLFEKQIIIDTLIRANWIKKRAADMLRIDARNLPYLLRKHNLSDGIHTH
ncbi:MAG: sigma 54-interacting transcriptional regulator [candidate division KSB1 bacterium]|nr:sigma 54-interacting transcriptional regulator [candidate division KSB1 bacterium]MDZ7366247.1 sigma 54-interacting transcriptional regulator [candidate division KSB1 bacterium]MDZ7404465.1 sigma 54-interacting transcriptional regulator [candidate division KSB1 bacterium]